MEVGFVIGFFVGSSLAASCCLFYLFRAKAKGDFAIGDSTKTDLDLAKKELAALRLSEREALDQRHSAERKCEGLSQANLSLTETCKVRELQIKSMEQEVTKLRLDLETRSTELGSSIATSHGLKAKLEEVEKAKIAVEKTLESLTRVNGGLVEQTKSEFELIARKILESTGGTFTTQAKEQFGGLVSPLKEELERFQKLVVDTHVKSSEAEATIAARLESLNRTYEILTNETGSLKRALSGGDNKATGNWGEMQLKTILERQGFFEGRDFVQEAKGYKLVPDDGGPGVAGVRPDFIINLPPSPGGKRKSILIDCKTSVAAFDRYQKASDELERTDALKHLRGSIEAHAEDLASKNYDSYSELGSPSFVMMFIPIEAVFVTIWKHFPELITEYWHKKVVIVGPSTVLATLKTVSDVWAMSRWDEDAQEIAKIGGRLYDRFMLFKAELDEVGECLAKAVSKHGTARGRLEEGGNASIVSAVLKLKDHNVITGSDLNYSALPKGKKGRKKSIRESSLSVELDSDEVVEPEVVKEIKTAG